jgi:hypothetical protein
VSAAPDAENDNRKVCPDEASKSMKIHACCANLTEALGGDRFAPATVLGRYRRTVGLK